MINRLNSFLGKGWVLALGSFFILSVALFASPTAHAATAPGQAAWKDANTIIYNGIEYKGPTAKTLKTSLNGVTYSYKNSFVPASGTTIIYFPNDANLSAVTIASYNTSYSIVGAMDLKLTTSLGALTSAPGATDTAGGETAETCAVDGIGWIVCPIATALGKLNDGAYALAEKFLVFRVSDKPFSTKAEENPTYVIWSNIRNIANVAFVIALFIVIFSQATSIGLSNYGIKKMLPRIVVAALLINISYYICLFAIDISNIIGAGIDGIVRAPLANMPTNNDGKWEEVTAGILAGTLGGVALGVTVIVAAGTLFAFLAAAALAILTAFIVLVARQAFLVILIVLAPLAFAAYILPNTESMFDKWRKAFVALLVMYPLFAIIFAGSEVAAAIIRTAQPETGVHWAMQVASLGVQAIPLFALPFIVKFSGGVIGRVAGIVNNRNKGAIDRARKFGDQRSMANKAALVSRGNKWGKTADGKDKDGSMAKWKRRAGTSAAFMGGYEARRDFKENSRKADAERIQQGDIASRLQDENNTLAARSTLRGETGREIARARGIAIEDKLIGEEASAAKTVIENLGLDEKQKSQLSVQGKVVGADGKTILGGDFYQKAMHAQYAAQGRIKELEKAIEASDTMSDDVRGTLAYYLDQNFSTLKAKGHHLNSDVIKNKLRTKKIAADGSINDVKITAADNQAAAAQMTAGLNAEFLASQDPSSLEHLQQAISSGAIDRETANKVRSALETALTNPATKAKFTTDTRATAQSIVNSGKPAPPPVTEWNSGQPVVVPQPQAATAPIPRENIQTMSRVEIERIIEPVPGRGVNTLSDGDIAKLMNATRGRSDVADLHDQLTEERNKRRGGFDPGAGPQNPLP